MASPQIVVFAIYDPITQAPKTGVAGSLTFDTYKDETGANLTAPAFTEIGGGLYYFTPTFTTGHGIAYIVNTASNYPTRYAGYLRPEDFAADQISTIALNVVNLQNYQQGSWQIFTSGVDANRLVIYALDGVTVLQKYDLKHNDGTPWVAPTTANTIRSKV